jgi:hypothetical protein
MNMKKILSAVLLTSLMSVNLASFAANAEPIKVNVTNVALKSSLQDKYSAYRIDYINEGQNPVRVNDVKCYNRVSVADVSTNYKLKKSTMAGILLAPLTLGVSALAVMPSVQKENSKSLSTINECKRFNGMDYAGTEGLKTNNEILGAGQSIQFNVLVPLNETPEAVATLEDITTHKYIRVESTK